MLGFMHPAPVDRLAQRRPFRRTGRRSAAIAILLHVSAIGAVIAFVRTEPPPSDDAAPSEVALLFEGGLRQSSPLPPTERPSPAPLPSPTPGADTENAPASSPPPGEASALAAPTPAPTDAPSPPVSPPALAMPSPEASAPTAATPTAATPAPSATAEPSPAAPSIPDVVGAAPPFALASREPPPAIAAHPRPPPPRAAPPRPPTRPLAHASPRLTPEGFPTTLFGSTDLSAPSTARHAANAARPAPAARSSTTSDIHGGEDLGSDWFNEFVAYVERHKRYPEQAQENNDEGDSTVEIVVNRDGHVDGRDVDLVGRSGSQWLDLGLMAMFRGARLPPFPPGAPRDRETITVTMHYYLTR